MAKFNVMLLGHGRIAQQCAVSLIESAPEFQLSVLVTNSQFHRGFVVSNPKVPVEFISDSQRNIDQILTTIQRRRINMLISSQYGWILPATILDAVQGCAYNLHNGKLPRYQGYHSISHAIINSDSTHTVTLHSMAEKVDTGNTLIEQHIDITNNDTALSLYQRSLSATKQVFTEFLNRANRNEFSGTPIPDTGFFYNKSALELVRKLSWTDAPDRIDRIARACFFPPFEPAYIDYNNRKYFLIPKNAPSWEKVPAFNKSTWELDDL